MCSAEEVQKTVTFLINGTQVIFGEETDPDLRYRLRYEDQFALKYMESIIKEESIVIDKLYSIIRDDKNGPTILFESDETDSSQSCSNAIGNKQDNEWTHEETRFLLDKYEQYLSIIGPLKRFKTKKNMWAQIASDMEKKFEKIRTFQQVENRYKTILKRKKKSIDENRQTGNTRHVVEYEEELSKIVAIDDSAEPEVLRGVNDTVKKNFPEFKKKRSKPLTEVLLHINEQKERRHQEKMDILRKLIESVNATKH